MISCFNFTKEKKKRKRNTQNHKPCNINKKKKKRDGIEATYHGKESNKSCKKEEASTHPFAMKREA